MQKRHIMIYLPDGSIEHYSTVDMGDATITTAVKIESEPDMVKVVVKIDGKNEEFAYVRMPYILNIW